MEQRNEHMDSSITTASHASYGLRVYTLGTFGVEWVDLQTGQIIPLPPERLQGARGASCWALFKALLGCPDRFAPRAFLLEQFWPASKNSSATERLNDVASALRGLLRPQESKVSLVHFVFSTEKGGAGYRLESYPQIWCDADAFEWYVKHGMLLDQRGLDSTACWERAYTLAERGIYLPEHVYEEWAKGRRERLEGLLRDCVQRWTKLLHQTGHVDEAIMRLRGYWLEHPTDEDALRPLLEMLGERERFQEAEQCYAKTQVALQADGLEPDHRTQETMKVVRALQIKRPQPLFSTASVPRDSLLHQQASSLSVSAFQKILASPSDQKRIMEDATLFFEEQELDSSRRHLLQQLFLQLVGTAALPTLTLHAQAKTTSHERVSREVVTLYEQMLVLSWEQYYTSGALYASQHISGWINSLTDILPFTSLEEQKHLLPLLCRFYQLSGVAARDRMDLAQARHDGKMALELAFHLEDAELIAASLFRQAKTLLKGHRSQEALEHLEAACIYAQRVRDPLKGYVYQARADAYALVGPNDSSREQQSLRLLDRAEQVLANGNLEDDGSFVKLNVAGLALDRAGALIHFQQFPEARSVLESVRSSLSADLPRWQTRLLLAEAQVSLAEHALEDCCEKVMEALRILEATQSKSGLRRITLFYQQLSGNHSQHTMVVSLGEHLLFQKENLCPPT